MTEEMAKEIIINERESLAPYAKSLYHYLKKAELPSTVAGQMLVAGLTEFARLGGCPVRFKFKQKGNLHCLDVWEGRKILFTIPLLVTFIHLK